MRHFYFLFCLITCAGISLAQTKAKTMDLGNIVSDSGSVSHDLGAKFGLHAVNSSPAVIEIRLYSKLGFPGSQCVVLQYDKVWKATKYRLNEKDSVIRTVLRPAVGVESIARSVIGMNVFSLPSQSALNSGSYKLDLATNQIKATAVNLSDAPCYIVQFKTGTESREYKYCDPKAYGAFYKGQREYTDFSNILKAFGKLEIR